jgi:Transglycosylase
MSTPPRHNESGPLERTLAGLASSRAARLDAALHERHRVAQPLATRSGRSMLRSLALYGLLLSMLIVALAISLGAWALHTLAPAPGEWRQALHVGPWQREVGVSAALRLATHPMARPLIDGRRLRLASGEWRLHVSVDGELDAHCAPCRLSLRAFGPQPMTLPAAHLHLQRVDADRYQGWLRLGAAAPLVEITWHADLRLGKPSLKLKMNETPVAHVAALFRTDIPEVAQARIDGTLAFAARLNGPNAQWRIDPRLEGLAVDGLGTESLLDVVPPAACHGAERPRPLAGWLPRAVITAEDQRFYEHPGYDLTEMLAAWRRNQTSGAPPHGASTLTQQLAKLLYAGDERSAARKLREWLYAVEMERTLGKARILQLYLAVAPWGPGLCGAEAASRHYLRKSASRLDPVEAAWLASLLVHPEREWQRALVRGDIDRERVERLVTDMRSMSTARREQALDRLVEWAPVLLREHARRTAAPAQVAGTP